ncbi:glycosyltransferase family 4 protein [Leptolyngbya sp. NIES-2104]|uniref:glycosyltransferase family 4 protein n=1 Tax=Leptolyngbya sp. NIES-2104 TaxID=1552121 RepID=UPI0006EC8635|nr:glycosyltransferase family 1 protein [Leptolyngbya sp. NIES-2104]GAP98574.1 glycosyl transferase, group 1 [Leptolyngbya sp. NIES-2104]
MAISGQRPRIALISVHGDPAIEIGKEEAGGQNVYVRHVGEALSRQGWQVDMFTRKADVDLPEIVQHTPNCRTIRLVAGPQEFIPRDDLFGYLPEFVKNFQQFQAELGHQYPLVHTNYWMSSWVGMTLKKLQGCKQIHTYHSLGAVKYQAVSAIPMIAKTRLATEKLCLETAERIVATSPQEQEHMRSLVSQYGNIDIIPCGTDIERFGRVSRAEARQALGLDQDAKIVLYVGRFDRRKGIETTVRAVGQLKHENLKLIIGGGSRPGHSDGMERDRIEGIVNELGLQDITLFPGRLGLEDLHLYYAAADVCTVPSHYEPFGLVAIEAMASGTPVVASDVGGLQFTVIPEVTGLLAPPKDEDAFAIAIDRILADSAYRDQLGQAGRDRVEEMFSWDGVASQLGKLYQQVLKVQTKAPAAVSA